MGCRAISPRDVPRNVSTGEIRTAFGAIDDVGTCRNTCLPPPIRAFALAYFAALNTAHVLFVVDGNSKIIPRSYYFIFSSFRLTRWVNASV